uniref:Uncharacterized protein n=1 Tax=Arundo donax TaxID=35708 RepID=A0A0A9HVT3_ARUDO
MDCHWQIPHDPENKEI